MLVSGTMRDDRGHPRSVRLLPFAAAAVDSLTLSMQTSRIEVVDGRCGSELLSWRLRVKVCSTKVQQPHRRGVALARPVRTKHLRERPASITLPIVRIEGVRGSNPLSSTKLQQVSCHRPLGPIGAGSQIGSQVLRSRHGGD